LSTPIRLRHGSTVTRSWGGDGFVYTFHGTDPTLDADEVIELGLYASTGYLPHEKGESGHSISADADLDARFSAVADGQPDPQLPDSNKTGRSERPCWQCDGTGIVNTYINVAGNNDKRPETCEACQGKGRVPA
jgi:hypothetical protein